MVAGPREMCCNFILLVRVDDFECDSELCDVSDLTVVDLIEIPV